MAWWAISPRTAAVKVVVNARLRASRLPPRYATNPGGLHETFSPARQRREPRRIHSILFHPVCREASGAQSGLRQMDARGSADQLRNLNSPPTDWCQSPRLSGRLRGGITRYALAAACSRRSADSGERAALLLR